MKTNVPDNIKIRDSEENSKNVRMSLHVLQPAATDKENLVGPGRSASIVSEKTKGMVENEKKVTENSTKTSVKKKKMKIIVGESSKKAIGANDLTSEEPSEGYWKQLAEMRRVALSEALAENEALTQKLELLEQENACTQEMLNEARNLIQVLNEIIDGQNDDNLNETDGSIEESSNATDEN